MNDMSPRPKSDTVANTGLIDDFCVQDRRVGDDVWVDVIQRMEKTYSETVRHQIELEKKNAELEDAQNFIQSVISSISDTLIVCDVNGNILRVNEALQTIIDVGADQLIGKPLSILISDKYQSMINEFPDHIRSGSIIDCGVDFVNKEGTAVPMAVNCTARFDHEDRLSGFVITGRPLGELRKAYSDLQQAHEDLKNAQQQLIQSEKLASLGRLVAGVAHELNNPISFLYANMYALQDYSKNLIQYIDAVHGSVIEDELVLQRNQLGIDHIINDIVPLVEGSLEGAERVSEIVQNLTRFATPQKRSREEFDLVQTIDRAVTWVMKAKSSKPRLVTNMPKQLVLLNSEGHVHQILINLIQNAIDTLAEVEDPCLEIDLQVSDDIVAVHVKDNGAGIAEQDLVKIFDPFYTTKDVGSGTGLGLYISYGLAIEQCGGALHAVSNEGCGAEFVLSLPL